LHNPPQFVVAVNVTVALYVSVETMAVPWIMARKPTIWLSPPPEVALVRLAIFTEEPVATRSHVSLVPSLPQVTLPPPAVVLVEESLAIHRAPFCTPPATVVALLVLGVADVVLFAL